MGHCHIAERERIEILEHVLRWLVQRHPELFPPATEEVYFWERAGISQGRKPEDVSKWAARLVPARRGRGTR